MSILVHKNKSTMCIYENAWMLLRPELNCSRGADNSGKNINVLCCWLGYKSTVDTPTQQRERAPGQMERTGRSIFRLSAPSYTRKSARKKHFSLYSVQDEKHRKSKGRLWGTKMARKQVKCKWRHSGAVSPEVQGIHKSRKRCVHEMVHSRIAPIAQKMETTSFFW